MDLETMLCVFSSLLTQTKKENFASLSMSKNTLR